MVRVYWFRNARKPARESFACNNCTAMVEGVREQALAAGLIDSPAWDKGIADLKANAVPNGTFCYTSVKAVAVVPVKA
jgi:hypothetical protein